MMKRLLCLMLTMCLFLPMVACEETKPNQQEDPPPEVIDPAVPDYSFSAETTENKYSNDEGDLIASYSYQILRMAVSDTAPEQVKKMAQVFNARMDELLEDCLEAGKEMGEWAAYDDRIQEGGEYYTDELTATWKEVGCLVSVGYRSYSYTGAPHPNTYYSSYIFDLERGAFIDPTEIADDPELLRGTVIDLIADEIDGMGEEVQTGLFEDYINTVSQWNTYSVCLDEENLTVTFSAYALGPYALGPLSFAIPYAELHTALGSGGLEKLGLDQA